MRTIKTFMTSYLSTYGAKHQSGQTLVGKRKIAVGLPGLPTRIMAKMEEQGIFNW